MPHSRIRLPKVIKQERPLENLIDVNLRGCKFITKLPKLRAPNLKRLNLNECENLIRLPKLWTPNLKNLYLSHSIYKLQQLQELWTPTGKLRPTCNSFDSPSGYGFVNMKRLDS
ncbi:hypothetical protein CFP56_039481 [Quercus suber]|uniref:Disease resistance protein n=1 Tax=Quercus suber TaxID=58331 RepID=A0AAW0IZT1_QUESU